MTHVAQSCLFALAGLLPAGLTILAGLSGGLWLWAALISITLWVILMDRFGPEFAVSQRWSDALPMLTGFSHFAVLAATLWAVGQNDTLTTGTKVLLVLTTGLYAGQVSNACAHELIHRPAKSARRLGTAIYCSILNGHHVSAHLLVHHVHAGTAKDPNTAPLGQGFYRYFLNTTWAEFQAGFAAEAARRSHTGLLHHPYMRYLVGAILSLGVAWVLGGVWAMVALFAISVHAQGQLLLSDYVQHYGLRRATDASGKPEPMGLRHSWNAPQSYSAAMMMNAPRHSDHHVNPARAFPDLRFETDMPTLPRSMPVMAAIALVPTVWRQMMDHRAAAWSGQRVPADGSHALPPHTSVFSE